MSIAEFRSDYRTRLVAVPTAAERAVSPGRVLVLHATVGQGHEGAARELARRLVERHIAVEVIDYLDALPVPVRRVLRDLYHPTVQYAPALFEAIFRGVEHPGGLQTLAGWVCGLAETEVARRARGADVVVSTYPLASQTVGRLRAQGRIAGTAVTYLTDPAPHALWCHPDVDVHLTATDATAPDISRYGVEARVGGPLCAPRFGRATRSREAVRRELDLPDSAPVVLLSAGSLAMGAVPRTVGAALGHPHAHVVVLCGRNDALRRRLDAMPRVSALAWRDDVPELMAGADVLIHNAGGLSFTEALVAGLPALTYLPIPGHGRANAAQLERAAVARWPRTPAELVAAIDDAHRTVRPIRPPWPPRADPAEVVERILVPTQRTQPTLPRVSGF